MMTSLRKRKHAPRYRVQPSADHEVDPSLFIQAHEADIISGPQPLQTARTLEVETLPSGSRRVGDALIRWDPVGSEEVGGDGQVLQRGDDDGVWVDRYDARLLLDALPSFTALPQSQEAARLSPTGWSDLPSDSEDTFFLNSEEIEDYRRDKRRKVLENLREERLRALREEREEEEAPDEDPWGESDEEPDDKQKELMKRTATHLLSSPNSAQLEMRILANHGADPRFAFLKGRWSRSWKTMKARIRTEKQEEEAKAEAQRGAGALGGLAGYDSDSEGDEEDSGGGGGGGDVQTTSDNVEDEDAIKAARRARAKEWAEKRRAEKDLSSS